MPAIEVNHLTKEYRLGALQGLKQTLLNTGARLAGRPVPERRLFKALDDVSFTIEQGEVVGIIGHNGAGKSTLLKTLARVTTPSSGSVKVNGRIAPLIEVGAGFVPDFTGRENVYLNGAILGMSRQEIDRKFDEIVDFAEMAEFIRVDSLGFLSIDGLMRAVGRDDGYCNACFHGKYPIPVHSAQAKLDFEGVLA